MAGIALVFGLLAAACGSEAAIEASSDVGADGAPTAESDESSELSSDAGSGAETEGPAPAATADDGGDAAESEGPVAVTNHFFPDLNTVNIADGTTLNLAEELAGGDTPVLLWFFAPH